jgi:hypothetical protein
LPGERLSGGLAYKQDEMCVIYRATAPETEGRVAYKPEAGVVIRGGRRKIMHRAFVQHDGLKEQHSGIMRARFHGFVAAAKDRDAQAAIIIKRKPIAICTLHCVQTTHRTFFRQGS